MDLKTKLNQNVLISQNKEIDVTDMNGEKVMMNIELGQYFALNNVGSDIWNIIEEPKRFNELVEELVDMYDIERCKCEESVVGFLNELYDSGIVIIE